MCRKVESFTSKVQYVNTRTCSSLSEIGYETRQWNTGHLFTKFYLPEKRPKQYNITCIYDQIYKANVIIYKIIAVLTVALSCPKTNASMLDLFIFVFNILFLFVSEILPSIN